MFIMLIHFSFVLPHFNGADFPARPLLYEELSTVVTEAWDVEKDILTALSDPATSAEQLTQLSLKVSHCTYLLCTFRVFYMCCILHSFLPEI